MIFNWYKLSTFYRTKPKRQFKFLHKKDKEYKKKDEKDEKKKEKKKEKDEKKLKKKEKKKKTGDIIEGIF